MFEVTELLCYEACYDVLSTNQLSCMIYCDEDLLHSYKWIVIVIRAIHILPLQVPKNMRCQSFNNSTRALV